MRSTLVATAVLAGLVASSAVAWGAPDEPHEQGTYLVISKGDTLATEPFTRDERGVTGRVIADGRVLQAYHWSIGPHASVAALQITMLPGAGRGDSASMHIFVDRGEHGMAVTYRDSTMRLDNNYEYGEPVQAGVAGSVAFLEQLVRHARALGGVRAQIPIFLPATREQWLAEVSAIGADSMRVDLSGDTWRLETDAQGRILGGVTTASGLRLDRLEPVRAARTRKRR